MMILLRVGGSLTFVEEERGEYRTWHSQANKEGCCATTTTRAAARQVKNTKYSQLFISASLSK